MYIKVRVKAGARTESVEKLKEGYYDISVKEKAERNMANERVCELIAREIGVQRGVVRIINGHQSPRKLLSITIPE